jgi:hypothetical protein
LPKAVTRLGALTAGVVALNGCIAPVAVDAVHSVMTPSPPAGVLTTAPPLAAAIVGLFQREDKPFEAIGFSESGVFTEYRSAKPGRHQHFTGDAVVVSVLEEPRRKAVYVLSGDEIIAVRDGQVARYKRVMLLDVAKPPLKQKH